MTVAPPPSLEECLERVDELRVFPTAALRVLALVRDPEATVVDIEEALATDEVLAAGALSIANSAAYARRVPVRNLTRAVQVLGVSGARELVLMTVMAAVASQRPPWGPLLHRHALLAASISRTIASRTPYVDSNEAYVVGLLHNLGLQLLLRLDPVATESILEACGLTVLDTAERMRFGFTHGELSAMCMRNWGLPQSFAVLVAGYQDEVPPLRANAARLVLSAAAETAYLLGDGAGSKAVYQALLGHPANLVLQLRDGVLRQVAEAIVDDAATI